MVEEEREKRKNPPNKVGKKVKKDDLSLDLEWESLNEGEWMKNKEDVGLGPRVQVKRVGDESLVVSEKKPKNVSGRTKDPNVKYLIILEKLVLILTLFWRPDSHPYRRSGKKRGTEGTAFLSGLWPMNQVEGFGFDKGLWRLGKELLEEENIRKAFRDRLKIQNICFFSVSDWWESIKDT